MSWQAYKTVRRYSVSSLFLFSELPRCTHDLHHSAINNLLLLSLRVSVRWRVKVTHVRSEWPKKVRGEGGLLPFRFQEFGLRWVTRVKLLLTMVVDYSWVLFSLFSLTLYIFSVNYFQVVGFYLFKTKIVCHSRPLTNSTVNFPRIRLRRRRLRSQQTIGKGQQCGNHWGYWRIQWDYCGRSRSWAFVR